MAHIYIQDITVDRKNMTGIELANIMNDYFIKVGAPQQ